MSIWKIMRKILKMGGACKVTWRGSRVIALKSNFGFKNWDSLSWEKEKKRKEKKRRKTVEIMAAKWKAKSVGNKEKKRRAHHIANSPMPFRLIPSTWRPKSLYFFLFFFHLFLFLFLFQHTDENSLFSHLRSPLSFIALHLALFMQDPKNSHTR